MPRDISVEALMDSKEPQQMSGDLFSSSAALSLPKQGIEVVCFAENRTFANVERLGQRLQMQQSTRQLQI